MNIEPHETAIRTADGWAIYDKWNATAPTAIIVDPSVKLPVPLMADSIKGWRACKPVRVVKDGE